MDCAQVKKDLSRNNRANRDSEPTFLRLTNVRNGQQSPYELWSTFGDAGFAARLMRRRGSLPCGGGARHRRPEHLGRVPNLRIIIRLSEDDPYLGLLSHGGFTHNPTRALALSRNKLTSRTYRRSIAELACRVCFMIASSGTPLIAA